MPTDGEPDFNQTDKDESDQIGLTGFKMNRIKGASRSDPVDDIVFFGLWPPLLYQQFTSPSPSDASIMSVVLNYNIGFLFASGPFQLPKGKRERFSLALAYGADLDELQDPGEDRAADLQCQLSVRGATTGPRRPGRNRRHVCAAILE